MRKKKGQAAMEFLMTYGWAILAAIIVIGVLAVYFRPSSLQSESFIITAPWYGVGGNAVSTAVLSFEIKNNGGETLTPVATSTTTTAGSCNTPTFLPAGALASGSSTVLSFDNCALTAATTYNEELTVGYTREGSTFTLTSTGTFTVRTP